MMKKILLILVAITLIYSSGRAEDIPLGEWRTHFSYANGQSVELVGNEVYTVASGSLFAYNLQDNSIKAFSRQNGLTDIGISLIRYSKAFNTLVICYENGNIDLKVGETFSNIPGIKMKSTTGSKKINEICFNGDYAYLASDLGVVVLNLSRKEIKETYFLASGGAQNAVNDVAFYDGYIYAATQKGLFKAKEDDPVLLNFANWEYEISAPEYNKTYLFVKNFQDQLLISRGDSKSSASFTYRLESGIWIRKSNGGNLKSVRVQDKLYLMSYKTALVIYDERMSVKNLISTVNYDAGEESINTADGLAIDSTKFAIASNLYGLVSVDVDGNGQKLSPDGPTSNSIWDIDISETAIRVVPGALDGSWQFTGTKASVSIYQNSSWTVLDELNVPELEKITEFVDIISDPINPDRFFVASYRYGLFEFEGDQLINHFTKDNSTILDIFSGYNYMFLYGLVYDSENKLWLNNAEVANSFHSYSQEKEWKAYTYPDIDHVGEFVYNIGEMLVTEDDTKWVSLPKRQGLYVFNEKLGEKVWLRTILDSEQGDQISNIAYTMVEDNDGSVWVGTDNGIAIFYNPEQVFENKDYFPASRIKLPRIDEEENEGYADYLLDGEPIISLVVDGGNRKWIGTTSSGLFLVSPDGLQIIEHFTVDNSILPSNTIKTMAIDPISGELYIGTSRGLVSYRSDATGGSETFDDIKVFPNPVREDFNGTVSISGLLPRTNVKITDISGNLVYETTSNGGTAAWNAKNFYGERVGTGVYMIFCSTEDGALSEMKKILVINNK